MKAIKTKFKLTKEEITNLHLKIAGVMSEANVTIRSLEELTNHYYKAKDHSALKHTIASIDTFLLLFNPYTKYDLCRYWQVLEGAGYDPVVEYNKGLELFDMHFSPKPEDLFTIILQISRFLKEFSDFETKNTPHFRHPYIRGKIVKEREEEDEDDWLLTPKGNHGQQEQKKSRLNSGNQEEEKKFDIMAFLEENSKEAKEFLENEKNRDDTTKDLPFKVDNEIVDQIERKEEKKKEEKKKKEKFISFLDDIGLEKEIGLMKMTEELYGEALKETEKSSKDIVMGEEEEEDDIPVTKVKK